MFRILILSHGACEYSGAFLTCGSGHCLHFLMRMPYGEAQKVNWTFYHKCNCQFSSGTNIATSVIAASSSSLMKTGSFK